MISSNVLGALSSKKNRSPVKGFTLIELLVCIGVASVLSSFVLPTLTYCTDLAWSSRCKQNLRSLSTAFHSYALKNRGFFPHEDNGKTRPPKGSGWHVVLKNYGDKEMFQCPATHLQHNGTSDLTETFAIHSYKMNSKLESEKSPFIRPSHAFQRALILAFDGRAEKKAVAAVVKGTWRLCDGWRHADGAHAVTIGGSIVTQIDEDDVAGFDKPGDWKWTP